MMGHSLIVGLILYTLDAWTNAHSSANGGTDFAMYIARKGTLYLVVAGALADMTRVFTGLESRSGLLYVDTGNSAIG